MRKQQGSYQHLNMNIIDNVSVSKLANAIEDRQFF